MGQNTKRKNRRTYRKHHRENNIRHVYTGKR